MGSFFKKQLTVFLKCCIIYTTLKLGKKNLYLMGGVMDRKNMINTLIQSSGLTWLETDSEEQVKLYKEYLNKKSDQELKNMVVINCF